MEYKNFKVAMLENGVREPRLWLHLQSYPRWVPEPFLWWFKVRYGRFEFLPDKPGAIIIPNDHLGALLERIRAWPTRPKGRIQAVPTSLDNLHTA